MRRQPARGRTNKQEDIVIGALANLKHTSCSLNMDKGQRTSMQRILCVLYIYFVCLRDNELTGGWKKNNRCVPGERLFAAAANSNQQRIATLLANHSSNTRYVFYGIHEEDKLHLTQGRHVVIIQILLTNVYYKLLLQWIHQKTTYKLFSFLFFAALKMWKKGNHKRRNEWGTKCWKARCLLLEIWDFVK